MKRWISLALMLALVVTPVVAAQEGGEPGLATEVADYGAREAAAPELAEFTGGSPAAILLVLLLSGLCGCAFWLFEGHWHSHCG